MESTENAPKLFRLSHSKYVQYHPDQGLPKELKEYEKRHNGELPAFFLLPSGAVEFHIYKGRHKWNGKGPLPVQVMEYVLENGVLPEHRDPSAPPPSKDDDVDEDEDFEDYRDE